MSANGNFFYTVPRYYACVLHCNVETFFVGPWHFQSEFVFEWSGLVHFGHELKYTAFTRHIEAACKSPSTMYVVCIGIPTVFAHFYSFRNPLSGRLPTQSFRVELLGDSGYLIYGFLFLFLRWNSSDRSKDCIDSEHI